MYIGTDKKGDIDSHLKVVITKPTEIKIFSYKDITNSYN